MRRKVELMESPLALLSEFQRLLVGSKPPRIGSIVLLLLLIFSPTVAWPETEESTFAVLEQLYDDKRCPELTTRAL